MHAVDIKFQGFVWRDSRDYANKAQKILYLKF